MKTINIKLDTIEKVRAFVEMTLLLHHRMDLASGNYRVNAKSIMGIFSLDLSKPIQLDIFADSEDELFAAEKLLVDFIV